MKVHIVETKDVDGRTGLLGIYDNEAAARKHREAAEKEITEKELGELMRVMVISIAVDNKFDGKTWL
jgi:hypothetical protein